MEGGQVSYNEYINYSVDPTGRPRFYGVYKATVVDNNDPESRNRLSVSVPQVGGADIFEWAEACFPPTIFPIVPDLQSNVWVMFESGDPSYPVWIGVRS
ncbi:MAG: phage baseplate assembly protein V [Fluviibacter sp.]